MSQFEERPSTTGFDPRASLSNPEALYEVVDGRVRELPEMGALAQMVSLWLCNLIQTHLQRRRLGVAVYEMVFILDAERNLRRRPDVAFVSFERWPADRLLPEEGDWEVVPDLAVEVISPNDLVKDVNRKIADYFRYGVRQVWLVDPLQRQVTIYDAPTRVRILTAEETLEGGEVLPGFATPIVPLFRRTVG